MPIDKLSLKVTEYSEELAEVRKSKNRRPYLLAMLMKDLVARDIQPADVKVISSGLRSLGFKTVVGDKDDLVEELLEMAENTPDDDNDADNALVKHIKGSSNNKKSAKSSLSSSSSSSKKIAKKRVNKSS